MVFELLLIVLGLVLFETVSSVDNAVINAEVLSKMSQRARRWFLLWGLLAAVFLLRGLLPWLIVWAANPNLGPVEALMSTLSSDPKVVESVEASAPILLVGGGVFLLFLFLHWLFLEPKKFGLRGEKFFFSQGVWFYAVASVSLAAITWFSLQINPIMAFSAVLGSTVFFITHGFKQNAELQEQQLLKGTHTAQSDWSKIFYLEAIDASFSIDGVIGAFAFTLSVPLILLGNGLGAFVVREMTVRNIETVKKYVFLKNGAMYSIGILGAIMLADAFGAQIPSWLSPVATFFVIGYFFLKSRSMLKKEIDKSSVAKIGVSPDTATNRLKKARH